MKKRVLRKWVVYGVYALTFLSVFSSIYFIEKSLAPENTFNNDKDYIYVSKTIFDNEVPVVASGTQIIRPYKATDVGIAKNYYDYKADADTQKKALLYYEDTYLQNSGVEYKGSDNFDVVSILNGTVISIKNDNILGNVVEVRHDNDMISVYQSLSDVKVTENQEIKQGDIIGKSGTNNISKSLGDHLHFELIINGQNVNPEEYYNKNINEI